jgi:hypothetical protein
LPSPNQASSKPQKGSAGITGATPPSQPTQASPSSSRFDIDRIIEYTPPELVGRDSELSLLKDAWDKVARNETRRARVLTFVALGGEGKTSVVAKWAAQLAHHGWLHCDGAFAWSFYSQGTSHKTEASSDAFLAEALRFFGDKETGPRTTSAYDKGKRLAQLIGARRTLLILDGLEPLQYPPGPPMGGKLRDEGAASLLRTLATSSRGLCVVTTRYSIPDLDAFRRTTANEKQLKRLSRRAGVHLLKKLGVSGSELRNRPSRHTGEIVNEFEELVEDVRGHALTLSLLGSFLRDAHGGDIRRRDLIKFQEADAEEQGGHAFRVMDAYVKSFNDGGESGRRAVSILRLLGLFDRPATANCLNALWTGKTIWGLTEMLRGLSDAKRNIILHRLENARLLTVNRDKASRELIALDAHPLVREYFAHRVREQFPEAWRAAHSRLYEYLRDNTHEGDEPTLEQLEPLYQAVAHGCQAGLHQDACKNIYMKRIGRDRGYSALVLGAFGSDLAAEKWFFDHPWSKPSDQLNSDYQTWMLNEVGFRLRGLGRLSEAMPPMIAATERAKLAAASDSGRRRKFHLREASTSAANVSELHLIFGFIDTALAYGEQALKYADDSGDNFRRKRTRVVAGDAFFQSGKLVKAADYFRQADQIQTESQTIRDHSILGFPGAEFLLATAERYAWRQTLNLPLPSDISHLVTRCSNVQLRADNAARLTAHNSTSRPGSLSDVTNVRAALYRGLFSQTALTNGAAIDAAITALRRSSQQFRLVHGLLTRAWLRVVENARNNAQEDLDEAWEIAERGPMRLHKADIHLYRARLFHSTRPYPWKSSFYGPQRGPKDDLKDARKLIEYCGYWRRKEELEDAEEAAKGWE